MRFLVTACVLLVAVHHAASAEPKDKYTTRYDHIDVDSILKSERLLKNYFNCVMDRGPCTREGLELKKTIPDALLTECIKCSEFQKKQVGKVMAHVQLHYPDMWEEVLNKFDPDGTFRKKYGYDEDEDDDDDEDKK